MFITSWTIDIRMNIQIWLLYRRYKSEWYNFWWATIQHIAACACKVWTLFGQTCGQEECSQTTTTTTDKSWLHRLATDILSWAKKQLSQVRLISSQCNTKLTKKCLYKYNQSTFYKLNYKFTILINKDVVTYFWRILLKIQCQGRFQLLKKINELYQMNKCTLLDHNKLSNDWSLISAWLIHFLSPMALPSMCNKTNDKVKQRNNDTDWQLTKQVNYASGMFGHSN